MDATPAAYIDQKICKKCPGEPTRRVVGAPEKMINGFYVWRRYALDCGHVVEIINKDEKSEQAPMHVHAAAEAAVQEAPR